MAEKSRRKVFVKSTRSIKVRTVVILFALLTLTLVISVTSAYNFFWPGFQSIERQMGMNNALRLYNTLKREQEILHVFLADWANWDDSYRFIEDQNDAYIQSNLTATTFVDGDLNGIAYLNSNLDIIWAASFDGENLAVFPNYLAELIKNRIPSHPEGAKLHLLRNGQLEMLGIVPVTDSDQQLDPNGYIAFVRPIDRAFMEKLSTDLQLEFRAVSILQGEEVTGLDPPLGGEILTNHYRTVWFDIPVTNSAHEFRFYVDTHRDISEQAIRALLWNAATVLLGSTLVFVVIFIMLEKQVTQPLVSLSRRIVGMGRSSHETEELDESREDEIGLIAHEVNRMQSRILNLAVHDYLTGLPNRRLFDDRLDTMIRRSDRAKGRCGVIFIDLDGFKPVNDTYGHQFGDELLISTAKRLQRITRKSDTIARLGGDEFAMIVEVREEKSGSLATICDKLIKLLEEPFRIRGEIISISASIGCSAFPEQSRDPTELLRMADEAMYEAKHSGKGCWRRYEGKKAELKLVQSAKPNIKQ